MKRYLRRSLSNRTINCILAILLLVLIIGRVDAFRKKLPLPPDDCLELTVYKYESVFDPYLSETITDQAEFTVLCDFLQSLRKATDEHLYIPALKCLTLSVKNTGEERSSLIVAFGHVSLPDLEANRQVYVQGSPYSGRGEPSYWLYHAPDEELYNQAKAIVARITEQLIAETEN